MRTHWRRGSTPRKTHQRGYEVSESFDYHPLQHRVSLEFEDNKLERRYNRSYLRDKGPFIYKYSITFFFLIIFLAIISKNWILKQPVDALFKAKLYIGYTLIHLGVLGWIVYLVYVNSLKLKWALPLELLLALINDTCTFLYVKGEKRSNHHIFVFFFMFCLYGGSWKYEMIFGIISMLQAYIQFIIIANNPEKYWILLEYVVSDITIFFLNATIGRYLEKRNREQFVALRNIQQLERNFIRENEECSTILKNLLPRTVATDLVQILEESMKTGTEFSSLAMTECIQTHKDSTVIFLSLIEKDGKKLMYDIDVTESVAHCAKLFRIYDDVVERSGYIKVRTIMNMYLIFRKVSNSIDAIELCERLRIISKSFNSSIQIGVVTKATVYSGILGRNRLQWEMISRDVNVAFRLMESCRLNEIHFVEALANELNSRNYHDGIIEEREAKLRGIGECKTYALLEHDIGSVVLGELMPLPRRLSIMTNHTKALREIERPYEILKKYLGLSVRFKNGDTEREYLKSIRRMRIELNKIGFAIQCISITSVFVLMLYHDIYPRATITVFVALILHLTVIIIRKNQMFDRENAAALGYDLLFRLLMVFPRTFLRTYPVSFSIVHTLYFILHSTIMLMSRPFKYKTVVLVAGLFFPGLGAILSKSLRGSSTVQNLIASSIEETSVLAFCSTMALYNEMDHRRYFRVMCLHKEKLRLQERAGSLLNEMIKYVLPKDFLRGKEEKIPSLLMESMLAHPNPEKNVLLEEFKRASIVVVDLVKFTDFSATHGDVETFRVLNEIYGDFDGACNRYKNVIPVSTVGDCYICLSFDNDNFALNALRLALDIMKFITKHEDYKLTMRIGIESGEVFGGILLSKSRSVYELWGDTAKQAGLLEGTSSPGNMHISERYFQDLKKSSNIEIPHIEGRVNGSGGDEGTKSYIITREEAERMII